MQRAVSGRAQAGHMSASTPPRSRASVRPQAAAPKGGEQPPTLSGPQPRPFAVAKGQLLNIASAAFPALARLGSGALSPGYKVSLVDPDGAYAVATLFGKALRETSDVGAYPRPAQPLVLYEFVGCPFCRKVREAVSILDLDVLFLPCPVGGPTWREEAIAKGGKRQFPFLVDPNTGVEMYESDAIVAYLFGKYGDGQVPLLLRLGLLTTLTCGIALIPRLGKGSRYAASTVTADTKPLEFWGYEASPFVVVVREALTELEVPYVQRSCARGSPKRDELYQRQGHFQVPYIEDPNTGVAMFESADIVEYLRATYGKGQRKDA